jgi:hypothetical protein
MKWKTENKVSSIKEQTVDRFTGEIEKIFTNQNSSTQEIGNTTQYITIIFTTDLTSYENDFDTKKLQVLAESGGAFDFLKDPEEKVYFKADGEPL